MFDRFTDNAKKTMSFARQHAMRLGHDYIAPEHMLLGLLQQPDCTAAEILRRLGTDLDAVRHWLATALQPGSEARGLSQLPFTTQGKEVLMRVMEHTSHHAHGFIGSEHILIGLLSVAGTPAAAALAEAKVTLEGVRSMLEADDQDAAAIANQPRSNRLLLISNSTMHGCGYLEHCAAEIRDFLGAKKRVMFVPYALANHDEYAAKARAAFAELGHELVSAHELEQPIAALGRDPRDPLVDAVFVGGGNTFRLLKTLYETGLFAAIQHRAFQGMPYIGSSAGTNVATLSIRTTNDMPIVMPPSFAALQLVPFQINPHYLDPDPTSRHMGETREERIRQFHEENDTPVLGLREGCMLRVEGEHMELRGTTNARLFRRGQPAEEFAPVCDLSFLVRG